MYFRYHPDGLKEQNSAMKTEQSRQWAKPESIGPGPSLAPWKVVCARDAEPGRAETGSSICSRHDVGQCVTSAKR